MKSTTATLLYILAITATAAPTNQPQYSTSQYSTYEKVPVPHGYTQLSLPVPKTTKIRLQMHLMQQNVAAFEQKLVDISTPGHKDYGKHMSRAELSDMLSAKPSCASKVTAWLKSHGITPSAQTGDYMILDVTIDQAERLLNTKYKYYQDSLVKDRNVIRTTEYSLPKDLHAYVDFVQPTTMFGLRPHASQKSKLNTPPAGSPKIVTKLDKSCNKTITPSCLQYLYNTNGYTPPTTSTLFGIAGFLNQSAQYNDTAQFLNTFAPQWKGKTFKTELVAGGQNPQGKTDPNDIGEANLDVQTALSLASPINTTFYSVSGMISPPFKADEDTPDNSNEPYLEFIQYLLSLPSSKLPQTLSISYGDTEQSVPDYYKSKVCTMFGQLGARGVSILISSGDEGPGASCHANDGKNTTRFLPEWPTSCPWVTSIGGTTQVQPEIAWQYSGGGLSNFHGRPSYQDAVVTAFLKNNAKTLAPFTKYFNASGRAYPDVSAQASNFTVVLGGKEYLLSGTSAAAPTFASIVAMLNAERLKAGKSPLGFLNPWLYSKDMSNAAGLTDITSGRTTGCDPKEIPNAGFSAVTGWDLATGLGTPNFQNLRKALNSYSIQGVSSS